MGKLLGVSMLFLVLAVVFNVIGFQAYDHNWRLRYTEGHLRIAKDATDPITALYELGRAKELLREFPKEGNTDIWTKSPNADLDKSWESLEEIIKYCESIQDLTDAYQINHAMEELRVRLVNFLEGRYCAFTNVPFFFRNGWVLILSAVFWIFGIILSILTIVIALDRCNSLKTLIPFILPLILFIIHGVLYLIATELPVFYSGPI